MRPDLFKIGLAQRKATLGADYVEKNLAAADDFTRPFQEAMTAGAGASAWGDETIDPKTRSMMNLAMIGALGEDARMGAPLSRRAEQWCQPRGNPGDHSRDRDLLRRAPGTRMFSGRADGSEPPSVSKSASEKGP